MKIIAIALLLACFVGEVLGDEPRLLLVPREGSIKPSRDVKFDIYLCNQTKQAQVVPPLTIISTNYALQDITGKRSFRLRSSTVRALHDLTGHTLQSNSFDHTSVMLDVSAEAGDLVEIYIEIKGKRILRSNTVQLFCATKK
jgi:hypothetical protein